MHCKSAFEHTGYWCFLSQRKTNATGLAYDVQLSRRDAVRATAHGTGAGEPELQSAGQRFQTDSDHRSQLNESQRSTDLTARNKRAWPWCAQPGLEKQPSSR